ncbi:MAG: hypothetical protein SOV62_03260 [Alloprevotella sp.]|nr:hypothetical protein [Alloprevotella sp.]
MQDSNTPIEFIAEAFEQQWKRFKVPELDAIDLLDLMDHYVRQGRDFEAEICRLLAERKEPDNIEVVYTKAHVLMDEGRWNEAKELVEGREKDGLDTRLFNIEGQLRVGYAKEAMRLVEEGKAVSAASGQDVNDFVFDAAMVFKDYGYAREALELLESLPADYADSDKAEDAIVDLLMMLARYDEAHQRLGRQIDKDPFNPSLWQRMAFVDISVRHYAEAVEDTDYGLATSANNEGLNRLRLTAIGSVVPLSEAQHNQAIALQDPISLIASGDSNVGADYTVRAMTDYCTAGLFLPRDSADRPGLLTRRIKLLAKIGDTATALHELEALLAAHGDQWTACHEMALICFDKGYTNDGLEALRLAQRFGLLSPERQTIVIDLLLNYHITTAAREIWMKMQENLDRLPKPWQRKLSEVATQLAAS